MPQLDKQLVLAMTSELEAAARQIAEKHGIQVRVTPPSRFYSDRFKPNVEFLAVAAGDTVDDPAAADYLRLHQRYGLNREWLGQTFKDERGRTFRVDGLNPKAPRYPVIVTCLETGSKHKSTVFWVKEGMAGKLTPAATTEGW